MSLQQLIFTMSEHHPSAGKNHGNLMCVELGLSLWEERSMIIWFSAKCSLISVCQRLGGTRCVQLQGTYFYKATPQTRARRDLTINEISSGHQHFRLVKNNRRLWDHHCPYHQRLMWHKIQTLMIVRDGFLSEMSVIFKELTRMRAREDFINFRRREDFRS
jgi:hypothetical protein